MERVDVTAFITADKVAQGAERRQRRKGPHPGEVRLRRPGRGQEVPQAQLEEECEFRHCSFNLYSRDGSGYGLTG